MIDAVPEDTLAFALEKDMSNTGGKTNPVGKYTCDIPNIQDKHKTAPLYPPLGPRISVWLRVAAGRCGLRVSSVCERNLGLSGNTPVSKRLSCGWRRLAASRHQSWPLVAIGGHW